ncbi:transmembrane protein 131 homolog [Ostrinia furnacalis]|uniref:transmembrane protein 131 homolog n=1 Tax=Ostrinia furnacalis TaxID=93504 RepID=UPI00103891ED|nr:transmembrane protein 131 homolog [Ostrinia furnacalis]
MYRKIVWCYVLVLTLLDISLNTKLTAQGKSHDVTVQDSFIEGISFQEWGKESLDQGLGTGAAAEALRLEPASLRFGRAALGAAHALTVALTNTANSTVHLASVAGTTPDFHASFFESKTLPPNGNTTFSVVYLGRREGPVAAHLYIHTSLGVYKYPVSAEGVASAWGVWPLVGLRVPHNATLDPVLTLYNPTDKPVQVREVYSSGSWVGLRLPGGGGAAPREAWRVPPQQERALVRLKLRLPPPAVPHAAHTTQPRPLTAYIRIKGDNVGGGGGLVVAVEAAAAPAGTFLLPAVLSLRASGSRDPPHTFDILAGNSGSTPERVEASLWGARCAPRPVPLVPPPDAPPQHHNGQQLEKTTTNGVKPEGAYLSLLRSQLDPHQEATETLQLTLDFARLWASYTSGGAGAGAAPPEQGAWCGGYVRLGASSLPYSLRLLPGTLHLTPAELEVVTASRDEALREREVRVRNEFPVPVLISAIDYGPEIEKHFHVGALTPLVLQPGAEAVAARVRLRAVTGTSLRASLTLRTNLTRLSLPVLLHAGALHLEWEWPNSSDGHLRMGAVSVSSTRRVSLRIHNPAPATLCLRSHALRLPAAQLALPACRCIKPGERAQAWLTVVAPARAGALTGSVHVSTAHFESRAPVSLHAHQGRLRAHALRLAPAAPYVWSTAPLVLESSMAMNMRVVDVTQLQPDPAVSFMPEGQGWVTAGTQAVGAVEYAPERACRPRCYTGLDTDSPEGAAWLRRAQEGAGALREDVELLRARRAMFTPRVQNVSLLLHTTEVVQIPVSGSVRAEWPRLLAGAGVGAGGLLAGVGGAAAARLRLRNPSTRALLLHAALTPHHLHRPHPHHPHPHPHTAHHDPDHLLHPKDVEGLESFCKKHKCVWSAEAFSIGSWQARAGAAGVAEHAAGNATRAPVLLLAPGAELDLTLGFAPTRAAPLAAYLYLRNNLTIVEIIPVWGRGAYPSLELGGRRPGSGAPIVFEVTECASPTDVEAGVVRRALSLHNTGDVPLQLRDWRLAGQPCQARGFRLQPCAAISLAPNESRPLRLAFTADYTLARVTAALHVRADAARLEFALHAHAPAALLRACGPHAPRPPFEPGLRAAGAERRAFECWRAEVLRRAPADDDRSSEDADAAAAMPPPEPEQRDRSASPPTPTDRRSSDEEEGPSAESSVGSSLASDSSRADEPGRDDSDEPDRPATPRRPPRPRRQPIDPENRAEDARLATRARREASSPPRLLALVQLKKSMMSRCVDVGRMENVNTKRSNASLHIAIAIYGPDFTYLAIYFKLKLFSIFNSILYCYFSSISAVSDVELVEQKSITASPDAGAAPLPPIGSDVRRRAEAERERAADQSLFYFNGDAPPAPAWRAPSAPAPSPAPRDRPAYSPVQPDYRNDFDDNSGMNAYGSLWTGPGSSAWAWGGGFAGVRPPPGFAAPPPAPRAYDPFRSLAAIWAPGALDWRADPEPAAAAPAPPDPAAAAADAHASSLDAPPSRSVVPKTE